MNIYFLQQIETPRLSIRPVQIGDELSLSKAINNSLPLLQRWMPWSKDPSFKTTQAFVQQSVNNWQAEQSQEFSMVVIHKADNKIIAASGYNEKSDPIKPYYEIGYWIDSDYQGQGLVTEIVNALTRYALIALNAHRVQICTQEGNVKSIAVANRCGYKLDAIMQNYCIDCLSGLPANSLLFSCCDITQLPPLDITWQHKERAKIPYVNTITSVDNQPPKSLPKLSTQNLKISPPQITDTNKFYAIVRRSLAEISSQCSWAREDLTLLDIEQHLHKGAQAAKDIYSHDHLSYLVWDHNGENILGEIWLKILDWSYPASIMINYWCDIQHVDKGFATEAIAELVKYSFSELKARRIQLQIATSNTRSIQVANSLGFSYEGTLTKHAKNFVTQEISASELFSITTLKKLKV